MGENPTSVHLVVEAPPKMTLSQELIKRFLQNDCTDQEVRAVEAWYFSFEKNLDGISQMSDKEQISLKNEIYQKIKRKIQPFEPVQKTQVRWLGYTWRVATVLLVFVGCWAYFRTTKPTPTATLTGWVKFENVSARDLKVILPDGSSALLKPNTKLSYRDSKQKTREVTLTGEAFFDVRRDETRPFYVFTGKITTKVLGTSFNIKAYSDGQKAEVAVVSGKVTVYENDVAGKKDNGVVLTPNLKVVYFDQEAHFITGIVERPEIIKTVKTESFNFNFQDTPLADVLRVLEKTYGIEMVLENETLGQCRLTGRLEKIPLFEKLDIITRSLNATYQIKGTSILVSGQGCEETPSPSKN